MWSEHPFCTWHFNCVLSLDGWRIWFWVCSFYGFGTINGWQSVLGAHIAHELLFVCVGCVIASLYPGCARINNLLRPNVYHYAKWFNRIKLSATAVDASGCDKTPKVNVNQCQWIFGYRVAECVNSSYSSGASRRLGRDGWRALNSNTQHTHALAHTRTQYFVFIFALKQHNKALNFCVYPDT